MANTIKENKVLYPILKSGYRIVTSLQDMTRRLYLRMIELLLPSSYFLQRLPDLRNNYFPQCLNEISTYNKGCNRANRDGVRIIMAKYLLDMAATLEEGDYAELGTYKGNFARLMYKYKAPGAGLYCFDTFEGFASQDITVERSVNDLQLKAGHFSDTSMNMVRKWITGDTREHEDLNLIKGYFPGTFEGLEDKKWRFVNLDADLYEPMKEGAKMFWPRIVPGGILLIHDYNGAYAGTKKAIDEYFQPLGIQPMPIPDKVGSAFVIKPRN